MSSHAATGNVQVPQNSLDAHVDIPTALPKLIAFDLDYTLWPLWVDTHVDPPLKRRGSDINRVFDRFGKAMSFYQDVPKLLLRIRKEKVFIAACSRTHAPEAARQALKGLYIPADLDSVTEDTVHPQDSAKITSELIPAIDLFDQMEIYPGSKITHFKRLHESTGIDYKDMLFFVLSKDDESRNSEVETTLGVHFILCPDGLHTRLFENALNSWRQYRYAPDNQKSKRTKRKL